MTILYTIPFIAGLGYIAIIVVNVYEGVEEARKFNAKVRQWIGQHMIEIAVVACVGLVWGSNV